jgi:energy-coupling factor transporter ATP-binding protein EcfA2
MEATSVPNIEMSRDIKLHVDWKSLSTHLADTIAQGFLSAVGITDGISGAISALVSAFGDIGVQDNPEQKAWNLFWLSFAWSLDELRATDQVDDQRLRAVVADAMQDSKRLVDNHVLSVPINFMERPVTLPLYQVVRDAFVIRRTEFRGNSKESAADLAARFDASFSRAIYEIWSRKPDQFQSLAALSGGPGLAASMLELQWASYRHKLIHDFTVKPMFGQEDHKLSLSQTFVHLRCRWIEQIPITGHETTYPSSKYGMLNDVIEDWLSSSIDEGIVLLGGGPGSGKSTTVRHLARVAAEIPAIRPLYIPLQYIELEGNLRDSINNYFVSRTRGAFTLPPLSREAVEDGPALLLIFDGLDEIARPGEGADEIANLFISKLDQLQSALAGDSDKFPRIIVTGRLPSFQAAKRFNGAQGKNALEVLGYGSIDDQNEPFLLEDQRKTWWKKYSSLVGLDPDIPMALSDTRLSDITNEPLLCYLLVLSGFAVNNWEAAAENRNIIYQRLIDEVWKRGWGGEGKAKDRQGAGRHLSKGSFNDLMETIALAAWLGGDTRVATEEAFHTTLKITHAESAWHEFNQDGGEDVANLAMNFYLKAADGSQRGFEFTHKSFGDYLAARAIIALAREVSNLVPRYTDAALQSWFKATATGTLTPEILVYVRDEIRLIHGGSDPGPKLINDLFIAFETLVKTVMSEGLPAHQASPINWRFAARAQRNSEVMLWAVMNSCIISLQSDPAQPRLVDVGFQNNTTLLKTLLVRILIGDELRPPIAKCFSYMEASESTLFGLEMSSVDFSYSNLSGANLNGSHLMDSNLAGCNLSGAMFQRANLDRCSFANANVEDINLTDARLLGCDPLSGTVGNITVSRRSLLDLSLSTENISRVKFAVGRNIPDEDAWLEKAITVNSLFKTYMLSIPKEDRPAYFHHDEESPDEA